MGIFQTWLSEKSAGILLPVTALPGDLGIGNLGGVARVFGRAVYEAGFQYWQICPLGPTKYGDSPYSPESAFAGNPYLIDAWQLVQLGLLEEGDLEIFQARGSGWVDYGFLHRHVYVLLRKAYGRFRPESAFYGNYQAFQNAHRFWLPSWAAYRACKVRFKYQAWMAWPEEFSTYASFLKSPLRDELAESMDFEVFVQYLFWGQLGRFKEHLKVRLIGDVPFYAGYDSADVWAWPEYFLLNGHSEESEGCLQARFVSGAKPRGQSSGQIWGDPLYNWDVQASDHYLWWRERFKQLFQQCDVLRLDHFLAFNACWAIPTSSLKPSDGHWMKTCQAALFEAVARDPNLGASCRFIAEDLGVILPEVHVLRDKLNIPGLAILAGAFLDKNPDNNYLPTHYVPHLVAYSSTHDSATLQGTWEDGSAAVRSRIDDYIQAFSHLFTESSPYPVAACVQGLFNSEAGLATVAVQDLLGLDNSSRINRPGSVENNWVWRLTDKNFQALQARLGTLTTYIEKSQRQKKQKV